MTVPSDLLHSSIPWVLTFEGGSIAAAICDAEDGRFSLVLPASLLAKYRSEPFRAGDTVKAEVIDETGIYYLTLYVLDLTTVDGDTVTLWCSGAHLDRVQRRDAFRVKLLLESRVFSGEDFAEESEGLVRDLSETGIGLWTRYLGDGRFVRTEFFTSGLGNMSLEGEIHWKRPCSLLDCINEGKAEGVAHKSGAVPRESGGFQVGVQFVGLSHGIADHIRQFLWQLQLERRRMLND